MKIEVRKEQGQRGNADKEFYNIYVDDLYLGCEIDRDRAIERAKTIRDRIMNPTASETIFTCEIL